MLKAVILIGGPQKGEKANNSLINNIDIEIHISLYLNDNNCRNKISTSVTWYTQTIISCSWITSYTTPHWSMHPFEGFERNTADRILSFQPNRAFRQWHATLVQNLNKVRKTQNFINKHYCSLSLTIAVSYMSNTN